MSNAVAVSANNITDAALAALIVGVRLDDDVVGMNALAHVAQVTVLLTRRSELVKEIPEGKSMTKLTRLLAVCGENVARAATQSITFGITLALVQEAAFRSLLAVGLHPVPALTRLLVGVVDWSGEVHACS